MNQEDCFYHLDKFPDLPQQYMQEGLTVEYQHAYGDGHTDANLYEAHSKIVQSDFIKALNLKYFTKNTGSVECTAVPLYLKNEPMQGYEWHVDEIRTCAINFLITDSSVACTMFRKKINSFYFKIMGTVPYVVGRPFLFNTQIEHTVLNTTNEDRIILSVGLYGPSYYEVKEFLSKIPPLDNNYNFIK
jgi:hypothetical protein